MKIRTMLVDDDPNARNQLRKYLTSFPFIEVAAEAGSGSEAALFLREKDFDLLFLDIEMEDVTGMELASYIREQSKQVAIVFVTGHPGFALEGYAYQPIDYLIKPIDFLRLERAVYLVKEKLQQKRQPELPESRVGIKTANGMRIVEVKEILFIEKKGRKTILNLSNGEEITSSDSMKNLESIFLPFHFFRVHQSFLVSLPHVTAVYPDEVARSYSIEIEGKKKIPLSRNNFAEMKDQLEKNGMILL